MIVEPILPYAWITTAQELQGIVPLLAEEEILVLDTETSGWQSGNETLCLIQISCPRAQQVILIDTLAVTDLKPLESVLSKERPIIVAHNAAFERRQFDRYGIKLGGVRDTLTMSRELRPDLPNHTLKTCCKLLVGLEMSKEEQTSDWAQRPLKQAQINYARLDVEVTLTLYKYLENLEFRAYQNLTMDVPDLMEEYAHVLHQKLALLDGVAHEVAFLQARAEKVREEIKKRLQAGEPAYDGSVGKCWLQKVKRTEVNPSKVREIFPEFADQVIQEFVDRKRFADVSKEFGLSKNSIESVLDTTGFNERMYLTLKDESGEADDL